MCVALQQGYTEVKAKYLYLGMPENVWALRYTFYKQISARLECLLSIQEPTTNYCHCLTLISHLM